MLIVRRHDIRSRGGDYNEQASGAIRRNRSDAKLGRRGARDSPIRICGRCRNGFARSYRLGGNGHYSVGARTAGRAVSCPIIRGGGRPAAGDGVGDRLRHGPCRIRRMRYDLGVRRAARCGPRPPERSNRRTRSVAGHPARHPLPHCAGNAAEFIASGACARRSKRRRSRCDAGRVICRICGRADRQGGREGVDG